MGRRKKFGEESGFVNVRVPKSKVSEYREAIKKLINEKFSLDSGLLPQEEELLSKNRLLWFYIYCSIFLLKKIVGFIYFARKPLRFPSRTFSLIFKDTRFFCS